MGAVVEQHLKSSRNDSKNAVTIEKQKSLPCLNPALASHCRKNKALAVSSHWPGPEWLWDLSSLPFLAT